MFAPPALRPGQTVEVVAPSGPFDSEQLRTGLARLSDFEVRIPEGLLDRRDGFFAGDDATRRLELQRALDLPDIGAILIARGGYGLARIAPLLDFAEFRRHPKWIVGFSDATVLHCQVAEQGVMSLHAPNGTTLSRSSDSELAELLAMLTTPREQCFGDLEVWSTGSASGPLFGGNLAVLFAEAAAGRLHIPAGAVLFLEDVTETSYRIDRMLDALRAGGHFDDVAAFILGDFHECSAGKFDVPTETVLRDNLSSLGLPVLSGLPVGHGPRNRPLILGATTHVSSDGRQVLVNPK